MNHPEGQDLFLDDFFFLAGSNLLPGALLPEGSGEISYEDDEGELSKLTPLLPIRPELLDYFSAAQLREIIKIEPTDPQPGELGVRVSIRLELTGGSYTAHRDYKIQESNTLGTSNILPYLDLLPNPPRVGTQDPNKAWTVGVDFGTSFTNVYYRADNQSPKPLLLSSLSHKVTGTSETRRMEVLYSSFMPPESEDFPISTILTIKEGGGQGRPVIDGRIHFGAKRNPESIDDPELDYIITDLKWKTRNPRELIYNQLFLRNLALLISTEAARAHIRKIEWIVSHPSSLSSWDRENYRANWEKIVGELNAKTGMNHVLDSQCPCTEASAVAQYFVVKQEGRENLAYTTCIDMGRDMSGESSDISIWQKNQLIHQCSTQLAGRDLFSQFMKQYIDIIGPLLGMSFAGVSADLGRFYAKLDALLTARGKDARQRIRTGGIRSLDHALELSRLGVAGLYYYRLRVLVEANNDQLFCGEKCLVNDQEYSETSRLHLEGEISRFRVDENLSNLKEFVRSYHDHVGWSNKADRGGEEDPPSLKKFKESIQSLKDNESELWEKVGDKIERTCDTKMEGDADQILPEAPFIIGLKELLTFLNPRRRII